MLLWLWLWLWLARLKTWKSLRKSSIKLYECQLWEPNDIIIVLQVYIPYLTLPKHKKQKQKTNGDYLVLNVGASILFI